MNAIAKIVPQAGLVRYEAARNALQAAAHVDEVKDIRDKALAMAAYAKQANDTELLEWATEIKVRAERKAGQMLREMQKNEGGNPNLPTGTTRVPVGTPPTLADLGVTKNQSSRWQKLAAVPDDAFEKAVDAAKEVAGEVTAHVIVETHKRRTEQAIEPVVQKPVAADPRDARIAELEQELRETCDNAAELAHSLEAYVKAEEGTEAAAKEIKRLNAMIRVVEATRDQYMTQCAEMKKSLAAKDRKIAKLEAAQK